MALMAGERSVEDGKVLPAVVRVLVKRVMADPALSASAQRVMTYLLLEGIEACPAPISMAVRVGLTERSIRRAYAELREAGWLSPYRDWHSPPDAETPERQAILSGKETLPEGIPTFADHIAMLERIRDRALAKGDDRTALSAQARLGRALGYDRPPRAVDRNVRAAQSPPPPSQMGEGRGGGETRAEPETPGTGPLPTLPHAPARGRAMTGPEPAEIGAALAGTGSNWQELARPARAESPDPALKIRNINDLARRPLYPTEREWVDAPENAGETPPWLHGMPRAGEFRGGQNCPHPGLSPVPASD